jgi:hypothetical protein
MVEEMQSQETETLESTQETITPETASTEESRTPQTDDKTAELAKKLSIAERKLKQYEKTNEQGAQEIAEVATLKKQVDELNTKNFYAENGKYKPYEKLISALKKEGQTLDDVVGSEEFKIAFRDDTQPVKSVMHSNARVADESSDYHKDMEYAKKTGDWSGFLAKHKGITA